MWTALFGALMTLAFAANPAAQAQPLLQLQGHRYFGGSITLRLRSAVAESAPSAHWPATPTRGGGPLPPQQAEGKSC